VRLDAEQTGRLRPFAPRAGKEVDKEASARLPRVPVRRPWPCTFSAKHPRRRAGTGSAGVVAPAKC
jgi:hypothetical protein